MYSQVRLLRRWPLMLVSPGLRSRLFRPMLFMMSLPLVPAIKASGLAAVKPTCLRLGNPPGEVSSAPPARSWVAWGGKLGFLYGP